MQSVDKLILTNKVLTGIGYAAYPLLLVALLIVAPNLLLRCIVVPGASFVLVSVFRNLVNAKRPYEADGVTPLIPKDTHGKSFPSRHTFCMFMIAASWMVYPLAAGMASGWWSALVAAFLFVGGIVMATIRVVAHVHYPRDVIAGALFALLCAAIGYLALPW